MFDVRYIKVNQELQSECPCVVKYWKDIEKMAKREVGPYVEIGDTEKIFGFKTFECRINRVITASVRIV